MPAVAYLFRFSVPVRVIDRVLEPKRNEAKKRARPTCLCAWTADDVKLFEGQNI